MNIQLIIETKNDKTGEFFQTSKKFRRSLKFVKDHITLLKALSDIQKTKAPIYGKLYRNTYYLIDNVIDQLTEKREIGKEFSDHFSAMINSNLGEKYLIELLGKNTISEDDFLNTPYSFKIIPFSDLKC